ncbi:alpha-(1-_3)-arabinofuranosyltransferase [Antrihabitans spumae]|uniref:Alpha-(1->3)-arabinofuranosyltransferase n=1 Tax=Antrihabitans spumae TaxID=3373370 RepID=A0ABW7K1R3_9NOCA
MIVADSQPPGSTTPLDRRWFAGAALVCLVLAFVQSPGLTAADTKYDLAQNPLGFLARASHQWSSQAPLGQVQNQAYGYFFPHGPFFALGDLLAIPPWITQRIWWALLLLAGFWGIVRLAETLGIGSRGSRIVAGIAFALSPRVLTTLGSISSETLPMMLAPWVLLASAAIASGRIGTYSPARLAAQSAVAVALMGSVNAVATGAACLVAGVWWLSHKPNRAWWIFTAWWIPCLLLATLWWIVPLLLLGSVSPPFLDYIESAGVTTQWTSLAEVLRGTDSWTPFVSPERIAGAVLVTQPAAVIATGVVAAAGMAGLGMRSMPARGRLALILFVGLAGLSAGYVGELSSPIAESVRHFLDSGGAPLRNVHKLEPLIRLPLVLGIAHLLARVPLPASASFGRLRTAYAHPERNPMVALTGLVLVALTLATSLAWTGKLAPRGGYDEVPDYWHQTAQWLEDNSDGQRALVVPGAPFASQVWGLTRDEPLQALASTPWAVRDAVPLNPPGAIRAMDSVQRLIADGRPSDDMAAALLSQGIGYVVLRNDLDSENSRSTRPMLVHQAIDGSPGLAKVAQFGDDIGPAKSDGLVADGDLRPDYPAIEIYSVSVPGAPDASAQTKPYTTDLAAVPIVQGGPESLLRLGATGPRLLASDAGRAGLPIDAVTVTDTPTNRETDFGQVDNHSSALRTPDEARRTYNLVPDYPVYGADLVNGEWTGATVSVSSAASDATQLGGASPGSGPAATVDGDNATSWLSNGLDPALGQWLRLDLDSPVDSALLRVTTSPAALGTPVTWVEIQTENGSTAARVEKPGTPITVSLPPGRTSWIRVVAIETENGSGGSQFGVSEVSVEDFSNAAAPTFVPIRHRTVLPPTPQGAAVTGWDLGQELPGRTGCADAPDRVRCSKGLALAPEEPTTFERTLNVPAPTTVVPELTVRSRQGPALETLLSAPGRPVARGQADIGDIRGSAFAATDGDPRTSWTAPEDTVRKLGGAKPTLTIELPSPQLVTGLDIAASLGDLPTRPTVVSVNLGDGPQVRDLRGNESTIDLHPRITDRIELSIVDWRSVLDLTAIGFALLQPAGLSEVTVLGPDSQPLYPASLDLQRRITVDCADGPVLSVAGQQLRMSVTATVDELRSGAPVRAQLCEGPQSIDLPTGRQDVAVGPGPLFVADGLRLTAESTQPPAPVRAVPTGEWTENHRELQVPAEPTDQLLVVPQSNNVGWIATGPDGTTLTPVVVNGWQQGWIVPAGTDGTVTLEFPTDRWYRVGIFGGLLLLLPLFALAFLPARKGRQAPVPPRPWRSRTIGFAGLLALTWVIAGVAGPVLTVVIAAGAMLIARTGRVVATLQAAVAVAGLGTALSVAALSRGPWRAPDGYVGHSMWVQLPGLIAVIVVGLSVLAGLSDAGLSDDPSLGPPILRRLSHRLTARRTGSSTSA